MESALTIADCFPSFEGDIPSGEGVRAHDEFQALVDRFSEGVYNHAWRMLGSREEAEEATQDVFLRVHISMGEFRGEAQVST